MRLTGDQKKFFPHAGTVKENTWHSEVLLLFLSLRYGADLGRSRLVSYLNGSNRKTKTIIELCKVHPFKLTTLTTGANNTQGGAGTGATSGASSSSGSSSGQTARNLDSLGNLSSLRAQALFMIPPPAFTPLPNLREVLNGLSEEELREMEGNQRRNVQARIECLSQIQILLDTAVTQMNQYSAVMSELDSATTSAQSAKESKAFTSSKWGGLVLWIFV